jgi:hypothetical protein
MNKTLCNLLLGAVSALTFCLALTGCEDTKTYADMLEDEKNYIQDFIAARGYRIISEDQFDPTRKMEDGVFVLFPADGVYLHIDSLGQGKTLYQVLDSINRKQSGVRMVITTRFLEYSLSRQDTVVTNFYTNGAPEQFYYATNASASYYSGAQTAGTYGKFFASPEQTEVASLMRTYYGTSVPGGWLKPLQYVGDGGRVKIIIPAKMGTTSAQSAVLPYYYELQYKRY